MRRHRSHSRSADTNETASGTTHGAVAGLSLAADGLRFVADRRTFEPGVPVDWTFRILDDRGDPVEAFEESHGRRSHLVVVRRDLVAFQHLHPTLDETGTWHCDGFTLPLGGVYRAFVDVVVDGRASTLGLDLFASGTFDVGAALPPVETDADARYEVELQSEQVVAGRSSRLSFAVSRTDGTTPDLRPYLGARGHLVAVRDGDLAYLHVHPTETEVEGRVEFAVTFPTPGHYRLFLQAKPDDALLTTSFDVEV
ncbi:hypothetical protein [Halomarina rubra]|uniref:Secreted protein n=1 Tax=Halomarina rubra TaxID=2071873 RepID=A0ABD6AU06_9EURY|nr:hypothetical protein [Halomarina rubra]